MMNRNFVTPLAGFLVGTAMVWLTFSTRAANGATNGRLHLDQVVDRIQKEYQKTSSFKADFKEEIRLVGGTVRHRSGAVAFQKPGLMRWEFRPPSNEILVCDGKTVYNYQPNLNQVLEASLSRVFKSQTPVAFLLGFGNLKQEFDAYWPPTPPPSGLIRVRLKSKNNGATIDLDVEQDSYRLKGFTFIDQIGNVTKLEFENVETNVKLDTDKLFHFEPPPAVDIVRAP